jgi:NADH-quinone oxidoreductase subunit L
MHFLKALLFLSASSVMQPQLQRRTGYAHNMGGLKRYEPAQHYIFLLGCIAIAGMPPFQDSFLKIEMHRCICKSHYSVMGD